LKTSAISDQSGTRPFFYVSDDIKQSVSQRAVLVRPDRIIRHQPHSQTRFGFSHRSSCRSKYRATRYPRYLNATACPILISSTSILRGYDYEILKQVDLSQGPARCVVRNTFHFKRGGQIGPAEQLMLNAGYKSNPRCHRHAGYQTCMIENASCATVDPGSRSWSWSRGQKIMRVAVRANAKAASLTNLCQIVASFSQIT